MKESVADFKINDLLNRPNGFVFKYEKINGEFIHTYCEGPLLDKFGITPDMIEKHTLYNIFSDHHAEAKHHFYERAWNGEAINYEGHFNGVYYLATLNPIKRDSKVVEVIGIAVDRTKEKQNEVIVQKTEKLMMVGQLAAGIAHEIRNPLTSIKGFTQILKETVKEPYIIEYLDIMLGELDRIHGIVNEFMILSKPMQNLKIEPTNFRYLIRNVIKILDPELTLRNMTISPKFEFDISTLTDPNQMKQVFINLLQNAIDASAYQRKEILITMKDFNREFFLIEITDFGIGISDERQKNLFEPFYTTKEKGTGLGLMVCKRIIELHKGKIEINSKTGEGTVVSVFLPKQPVDAKDSIKAQQN